MIISTLKRWCEKVFTGAREKCTLKNVVDLGAMGLFAISNVIMSTAYPGFTIALTGTTIMASYLVDIGSNWAKTRKLKKLKGSLETATKVAEDAVRKYPAKSKGIWTFLGVGSFCLVLYVAFSLAEGEPMLILSGIAVVGASTIFHIAKKVYNSSLTREISKAEKEFREKMGAEKKDLEGRNQELTRNFNALQARSVSLEDKLVSEKSALEIRLRDVQGLLDSAAKLNAGLTAQTVMLREENTQLLKVEDNLSQRLSTTADMIRALHEAIAIEDEKLSKAAGAFEGLQKELYDECDKSKVLEEDHKILVQEFDQVNKKMEEKQQKVM